MKFKVGDRVVYVCSDNKDDSDFGKRGLVKSRSHHGMRVYVIWDGDEESKGHYYDRRFIFEYVYDSPLYQALL